MMKKPPRRAFPQPATAQSLPMRLCAASFAFLLVLAVLALLSACASPLSAPTATPTFSRTPTASRTFTVTSSASPTATPTPSPTVTPSPSATPTTTSTQTPTPQPTYAILRGVVNVEHVACFYGPSKAYLYKYGLLGGSRLEILGILPDTGYIQVRAIGGDNPCWMNLEWMNVEGDIASLQPINPLDIDLPWSPYYGALDSVSAVRNGNEVVISWSPLYLRPGDDSEQEPYLVEAWVCREGRLTFIPIGAYTTQVTVTDEPGCAQPSYARVYGVEKHGYTPWLKIDLPK